MMAFLCLLGLHKWSDWFSAGWNDKGRTCLRKGCPHYQRRPV